MSGLNTAVESTIGATTDDIAVLNEGLMSERERFVSIFARDTWLWQFTSRDSNWFLLNNSEFIRSTGGMLIEETMLNSMEVY